MWCLHEGHAAEPGYQGRLWYSFLSLDGVVVHGRRQHIHKLGIEQRTYPQGSCLWMLPGLDSQRCPPHWD